jgi:hypothetical protein
MTRRMVSKKGATKLKRKGSKPTVTAGNGWRTSKCSEADLKMLIDECLLQPKEIIQWRPATGDKRPYEKAKEIILFQYFLERGLALEMPRPKQPELNMYLNTRKQSLVKIHYTSGATVIHSLI